MAMGFPYRSVGRPVTAAPVEKTPYYLAYHLMTASFRFGNGVAGASNPNVETPRISRADRPAATPAAIPIDADRLPGAARRRGT